MTNVQARVISVAAPPGGGKTTLSRLISARCNDAPILHYDDYEAWTRRDPAEIQPWLERGGPIDQIAVPGFAEKLAELRSGPAPLVVVDAPLGRAHPATAETIDFLIFVDTPLDIALARVVRHQAGLAARSPQPEAARDFAGWLEGYLGHHIHFMRRIYEIQRATIIPQADLVLDGALAPERLIELAMSAINNFSHQ